MTAFKVGQGTAVSRSNLSPEVSYGVFEESLYSAPILINPGLAILMGKKASLPSELQEDPSGAPLAVCISAMNVLTFPFLQLPPIELN